jgi:hypothetical protein
MPNFYRVTLTEREFQAVKDALLFLQNECIITEEIKQVRFLEDLGKVLSHIEPEQQ